MLHLLSEVNAEKREKSVGSIHDSLFQTPQWRAAKQVALTISTGWEIPTEKIIEQAWEQGKKVGVPKCNPLTKQMQFRMIEHFSQVEKGYANLYEPIEETTSEMKKETIDLMIVPGICFDRRGFRIGYGGGFFDRYLVNFRGNTLSIAFSFQVLPEVPHLPHDLPVEKIVTEKEMIHCLSE
jgi:5-formyltetrahydrofolate cyclo-ligase